jgi:hypothetical protein
MFESFTPTLYKLLPMLGMYLIYIRIQELVPLMPLHGLIYIKLELSLYKISAMGWDQTKGLSNMTVISWKQCVYKIITGTR